MEERKRILILSLQARTEINPRAFRIHSLIDGFEALGHQVVHISANEEPATPASAAGPSSSSRIIRSVHTLSGNLLWYLFPEGRRFFAAFRLFGKVGKQEADLLISVGLPFSIHLMAVLLQKTGLIRARVRIADYGDPFSTAVAKVIPPYAFRLERWVLRAFDYVALPTEASRKAFEGRLVPAEKIRIIRQGFDLSQDFSGNYRPHPIPTFAYAGVLYHRIREPRLFLEHLAGLERDFRFILYTDLRHLETADILSRYRERLGGRMEIRPMIPRLACIEQLGTMDFLVNFPNTVAEQTPSKIIDYTVSGRPFLHIDTLGTDFSAFDAFLRGDYSTFARPDLSEFDERHVARLFLNP